MSGNSCQHHSSTTVSYISYTCDCYSTTRRWVIHVLGRWHCVWNFEAKPDFLLKPHPVSYRFQVVFNKTGPSIHCSTDTSSIEHNFPIDRNGGSNKHPTRFIKSCPHCHQKWRLSPKSATVAENDDCCTFLRQSPFSVTNCRQNRRTGFNKTKVGPHHRTFSFDITAIK